MKTELAGITTQSLAKIKKIEALLILKQNWMLPGLYFIEM